MSGCYRVLPLLACCVYSRVSLVWHFRYLPSERYLLSSKVHVGKPHAHCLWDFLLSQCLGRYTVEHVGTCPFMVLSLSAYFSRLFFYSLIFFSLCVWVFCLQLSMYHTHAHVRRAILIPWDMSYGQLWVAVWMLGIGLPDPLEEQHCS